MKNSLENFSSKSLSVFAPKSGFFINTYVSELYEKPLILRKIAQKIKFGGKESILRGAKMSVSKTFQQGMKTEEIGP